MVLVRAIWSWWKSLARRFANFQARLVLSLFYFVVLGPFAVAMRLVSDPLRLDVRKGRGWIARPAPDSDPLALARRQF